jgi:tetratricopeptide (TPR) repeat protein
VTTIGANQQALADLIEARRRLQAGDPRGALEPARRAALADPSMSEAFGIWGVAAVETGAYDEAIDPLRAALKSAQPGAGPSAVLASQLALALHNLGRWRESLERLTPLEREPPADPLVRNRMGVAMVAMNFADRGLPHLEFAARARPDSAELLCDLGWALLSVGDFEAAERRLGEALAIDQAMVRANVVLAGARRWTRDANHVDRLAALRADPAMAADDAGRLGFALAKELDDVGRYEEAWSVLAEANDAARAASRPWSATRDYELVKALIRRFPKSAFADPSGGADGDLTPIFVVGLPRSGTTLVERILAAHSQARAMGELPVIPTLARFATRARGPTLTAKEVVASADFPWPALGARYLAEIAPLADGARFAIDKLPANSLVIGPIRLALPRARIILVSRGPMDSLFSAYRMRFSSETSYGWSFRLDDLAGHYRYHQRLMNHWRSCLGEGLIEVSYEGLLADPEARIRDLLAACGLGFEPVCLSPHLTAGVVLTGSRTAVRAPMNAASVGAWRRYASQLEPLRARLDRWGLLTGG